MPTKKIRFRVGGVPEHFNYLWKLSQERNSFNEAPFDFQWKDYPGGTGAMLSDLAEKKLDLALLLTEGALTGIHRGNPSRIISTYVESPLLWGIHSHTQEGIESLDNREKARFAISRPHSGSHLMAYLLAESQGWNPKNIDFIEVGNLEGARASMAKGESELFMWEKYTSSPWVLKGEWRRVGVFPSPWPAFVLVGRVEVLEQYSAEVRDLLKKVLDQQSVFSSTSERMHYLHQAYAVDIAQLEEWYPQTSWTQELGIARATIQKVQEKLQKLEIISQIKAYEDLVWED